MVATRFLILLTVAAVYTPYCSERRTLTYMDNTVINHTSEKFTDVAVNGRGYFGEFGNVVSGGNKSASYWADQVADEFEVVWVSPTTGRHRTTFPRPAEFDLSDKYELIVEFKPDGSVIAYTHPKRPSNLNP